jgi:hypothetical protein
MASRIAQPRASIFMMKEEKPRYGSEGVLKLKPVKGLLMEIILMMHDSARPQVKEADR